MTIRLNQILVAKDLSEQASNVIRYALELGSRFDARIHILHVMPTVDSAVLNMVALSMGPDRLAELNAQNEVSMAEQTLEQLREILREETERGEVKLTHPPEIEVIHGDPAPKILEVADRLDADMIVIGSHSKGRLHYAFLGSVAEKILHKSHRTVVIVPPGVGAPE